ncbi:MAG: proteasome assembly chaperone family protein [Promethearchaeota archaeon]
MDGKTEVVKCCKLTAGIDSEPVLIVGCANAGLVGSIAASHIIEKMEMVEVAHLNSPLFPPVSVFLDGVLKHPFRIYSTSKDKPSKYFLATTELPLTKDTYHGIAHSLMDFAQNLGIKTVVTLVGFPVQVMEKYDVFFAAEPELIERLNAIESIQPIPKGMIFGIEALILNETLEREVDGFSLIVPVKEMLPATRSAAALIEALNKIFDGLNIDVQDLLDQDDFIQNKLKELAEEIQRQKATESGQYIPPKPSKSMESLFT